MTKAEKRELGLLPSQKKTRFHKILGNLWFLAVPVFWGGLAVDIGVLRWPWWAVVSIQLVLFGACVVTGMCTDFDYPPPPQW